VLADLRSERVVSIIRAFSVPGRPAKDRAAIARAFVAKAVYNMPTTRVLLDRLSTDVALRWICGWENKREVPSESVFSRAFAEFADAQLSYTQLHIQAIPTQKGVVAVAKNLGLSESSLYL
jgi:transposase